MIGNETRDDATGRGAMRLRTAVNIALVAFAEIEVSSSLAEAVEKAQAARHELRRRLGSQFEE